LFTSSNADETAVMYTRQAGYISREGVTVIRCHSGRYAPTSLSRSPAVVASPVVRVICWIKHRRCDQLYLRIPRCTSAQWRLQRVLRELKFNSLVATHVNCHH